VADGDAARSLLADIADRARNRRVQLGRLTDGGPIHLAMCDAQRADLALIQLLVLAASPTRTSMDAVAEQVMAVRTGRWDAASLLREADRLVGLRVAGRPA